MLGDRERYICLYRRHSQAKLVLPLIYLPLIYLVYEIICRYIHLYARTDIVYVRHGEYGSYVWVRYINTR